MSQNTDSAESTAVSRQCKKCGAEDWDQNGARDGATTCGNCGWRPRRERRQELEEVLD